MDLAITIFWVGVGVGAVLVGIGVIMIALSLRPVARDMRALANDARRLTRLAESELTNLLGRARELTDGAEELSADLAVQLDALKAQTEQLEQKVMAEPAVTVAASIADPVGAQEPARMDERAGPSDPMGRQPIGSVQSPHAREDDQIA